MKRSSLVHYIVEAFKILRKDGLRAILDPGNSLGEYSRAAENRWNQSFIESLDYSSAVLTENRNLMERLDKTKSIQVETVNWFIPYFRHPYGGIHTILRFANFFRTERGVKNRFIVCDSPYDSPLKSETEIGNKIGQVFPSLLSERIIVLRGNSLEAVPQADVCIATLWTSAFVLLKFNKTIGKFYFIQDYEPLFYPAGAMYALVEATYRFGFYAIVNSPGLYDSYVRDYRGVAEYFTPSIDRDVFYPSGRTLSEPSSRNPFNVFFYARADLPRNAFDLGIAALKELKRRHGESVEIFAAGSEWDPRSYGLGDSVNNFGVLPYKETGFLYRKCDLGIVFTLMKHPSYIPFELMACGCAVLTNYNSATTWLLKDGFNCLVTEPTVSCICEKVNMLMNDLNLRKQIVKNALDMIRKASWDEEMAKIYRFICNPHLK